MTVEDEIAEAEKDMEANLEKTRMKVIAENEKQLQDMKANLNEAMRREEKKLEEQMAQRKEQILTIKRQNLEERLKMAGEMTQEQIKELRLQYEREYNNLEKVIAEEKAKQLANMRAAMLQRRIEKERKRRQAEEDAEAARSRAALAKMNSNLASAFQKMIQAKMSGNTALSRAIVDGDDRLLARLNAWQRQVEEAQNFRGGEEGEIWHIEAEREKEKAAEAEAQRLKDIARAEKESKIAFTVKELHARVMKVEQQTLVLKEKGFDVKKIMENTDLDKLIRAPTGRSELSRLSTWCLSLAVEAIRVASKRGEILA